MFPTLAENQTSRSATQNRKIDTELGEDILITQQAYEHASNNSNDAEVIRNAKRERDAAFGALQDCVNTLMQKTNASPDVSGELKRAKDHLRGATDAVLYTVQIASYPTANKEVLIRNLIMAAQKVEQLESD